jgi:cytochrome P450
MIDGSRHRRLRGLVAKAFTPRRAEALRPRVEALVAELLERMAGRDHVDLMRDLAQPLPTFVIAELLGVPTADHVRFRAWSNALAELLDPLSGHEGLEPPKRATRELGTYLRGLLAERRGAPRDDLLSAMGEAEEDGASLAEGELVALAALLLAAANRDPEQFPDPERFDIGRADNHHLSFGLGNHFCLGASLAHLEAQVTLGALLRRFPDFDGPPEPPAWQPSIVLRGPTALPLRL